MALTPKALNRAVHSRKPQRGLIFHTDRGVEYAAHLFIHAALKSCLPYCNSARLHSLLDYVSPATFEQLTQ